MDLSCWEKRMALSVCGMRTEYPKKEVGLSPSGDGREWDQPTVLASNDQHGNPTLPVQRSTSTPKDRLPSTHHRTCKRRQDIHLAESVSNYVQPSYIPSNGHREKEREGAWSRTVQSCQFSPISPQIRLEPTMDVSDTRTSPSSVPNRRVSAASTPSRMNLCSPSIRDIFFTIPADSRLVVKRS